MELTKRGLDLHHSRKLQEAAEVGYEPEAERPSPEDKADRRWEERK